ncbi:AAA family ATPase [Nocardia arthritidis]|uniref:AAA family ATPase n=1 Tax=Nocardia arthritidis TaxID=228602 RepID=A0A6G9YB94_9NOCA|nr:AAA family ATPase [Nocardia arthritidis]QIS10499.1 AAA family ATPase [Nocardia arthritidis]
MTEYPPGRPAAPMAMPERLTGATRPLPGEPFWVLHGSGLSDLLVGADLRPRSVEEMLWEILHFEGYERIVFSDYRQPVYFRDARSRGLTRGADPPPSESSRRTSRFAGPLGKAMLLDTRTAERVAPALPRGAATDTERLRMLDGLMTQPAPRTAVVVLAAETWLPDMPPEVQRSAAEMFVRWSSGRAATRNTCVLLFNRTEFAGVVELLHQQSYAPQLADRMAELASRPVPVIGRIDDPAEAELGRLVHYVRLLNGLRIGDWAGLGHLMRVMAAQRLQVRNWWPELVSCAERDIPLTVAALERDGLIKVVVPESRDIWRELDGMVGLRPVKEFFVAHRSALAAEAALRVAGRGTGREPVSPHLIFRGSPGTGKTMVARMIGELYRDLGLLRRGHLVEAKVSDLVSPYVGDTPTRTEAVVRRALDGVLFIDEAYRLNSDRGLEAVNVLLADMENLRDRLVVILAGYPDRMADLLTWNEGLSSRIPPGNRVEFPDFEPDELLTILRQQIEDRIGIPCAPELLEELRAVTRNLYLTRDETFGNARTMRELAADILRGWAVRTRPTPGCDIAPATIDDIPPHYEKYRKHAESLDLVLAELDPMIGLGAVKQAVRELALVLRLRQQQPHRRSELAAPHMLFLGPPGTGKTTVARLMGRIFVALGLLVKGHVVSVTRADLVAGYVGQTAEKTRAKAMEALDGVLFVDEAYDLAGRGANDFGSEAITELVALMENYRGRLSVIAAGYPREMMLFERANSGLASRFTHRLEFANYTVPELRSIFEYMAHHEHFELAEGTQARAVRWLEAEREAEGEYFGNGRSVRKLLGLVETRLAVRIGGLPPDQLAAHSTLILPVDVPEPE